MAKYRCYGIVTGTKYLGEVEAENAEEAKEQAFELETCYVSVCHQCAHDISDPEIHEIDVELSDD